MLCTGREEAGDDATFQRLIFDGIVVLASVEDVGGGAVAVFFTHDHDGDGATGGGFDLLFNDRFLRDGVTENGVDGAVVVGEDFGVGGFLQLGDDVGGNASGFGGGIGGFGGKDAEGADLVGGEAGVELESEGELAGVGWNGFVENEEEAFGFVGVAVDGPSGGFV